MDPQFLKGFYETMYILDMGISCVETLSQTTSDLWQNLKVPVIRLLSRLFKQVITPVLKKKIFLVLNLLSIIFNFAFTQT